MNSAEYLRRLREQQEAIERSMLERERAELPAVRRIVHLPGSRAPSPSAGLSPRRLATRLLIGIGIALCGGAVALLLRETTVGRAAQQSLPERRSPPTVVGTESATGSRSERPPDTRPAPEPVPVTPLARPERLPVARSPGAERSGAAAAREPGKGGRRPQTAGPIPAEQFSGRSESIAIIHQSP
jgi:hypothetical protein